MRFIAVDWGTSRFRAYLAEDGRIVDSVESEEGVSKLKSGQHEGVFQKGCGPWLAAKPDLPVALVGMVGSREGWREAPYVACAAGPAELAQAMMPVDLGAGKTGHIVPGLTAEPDSGAIDVLRGEETHVLGAGVSDGLVCLAGTHCKWVELREGRVQRFATYMTGEMYGLLRQHSMIGRPATDPSDPAGFDQGLEAAKRNAGGGAAGEARVGLLHLLFGARAAAVTGRLPSAALGPYISGLLTGDEINGALALFGTPREVTVVAEPERAELYVRALGRRGITVKVEDQEPTLLRGLAKILAARPAGGPDSLRSGERA